MLNYVMTKEKLAFLGVLDNFYDTYDTLYQLYDSAWDSYRADIPDDFIRSFKLDSLLWPTVKRILNQFFDQNSYLFTNKVKRLYANSSVHKHFTFLSIQSTRLLHLSCSCLSFTEFLTMMEDVAILSLRQQMLHQYPKISTETVQKLIVEHFNSLAEASKNRILLTSADSTHSSCTIENVIVFKSLSNISCNLKGHTLTDGTIKVALLSSKDHVVLPVHQCKECGITFIGNETLKVYEKAFGKMALSVRKDTLPSNLTYCFTNESPLHRLGYNVVAGELTPQERQALLIRILEGKSLTLFQIQRDIENAIRIFQYRPQYARAVNNWKEDLFFISEYAKNMTVSDTGI